MLPQRPIGSQGLVASAQGLGCMGMSAFYGKTDEPESVKTIERAIELGCNFLDTADVYGPFTNEELVGKVIRNRRDDVVLATKFGIVRDPNGPMGRGANGKPEYVRSACDASLQRLGIDHIDLYHQHRIDASTPIEDTVGAMAELVEAGKIRYIGLSEPGPETVRRAHATHPVTAIQNEWSLWSRDLEADIVPVCRELGIGIVAYSPLGRGFLTGRFKTFEDLPADDYRRINPRFQGDNFQKNLDLVRRIEDLAREKQCTPSQLALAWLLAQGDDIVPIPGTKRRAFLEENVGALEVSLTPDELHDIDRIAPKGVAAGPRYAEGGMRTIDA